MTRFVRTPVFGRPRRHTNFFLSKAAGGAVANNVTLDPASYAYTGRDLSALTARKATLSAAGYTVTASSLTAVYGQLVTLSRGSYAYTGSNLAAQTTRNATLTMASFAYTGAGLTTLVTRQVALTRASFLYTGLDLEASASVQIQYDVTLTAATFAYTGQELTAVYTAVTPPVTETPPVISGGGGGGGSSGHWYRGKYRHEIKKAIRRALADLDGVRSSRSRKRRVRRIASAFVQDFTFDAPLPVIAKLPDIAPLEPIRLRLLQIGEQLRQKELAAEDARAKTREMEQLFAEYERELARIETEEEEEAVAMILAIAA